MLLQPRYPVLLLQLVFMQHVGLCCGSNNIAPGIETARIYGNIYTYAYYFVDLLVGTPPQRTSVILDTGSRVCAFTCTQCRKKCGSHLDRPFDFEASNTSSWTDCGAGCNGGCDQDHDDGDHCSYFQHYTEGSAIRGWWFDDVVRLGDSVDNKQPNHWVWGRMGCHRKETNLFYTQEANGMLGVGPNFESPETGVTPLLQQLYKDRKNIREHIFSICLAEWGGMLAVGGFNVSYHTGPVQWVDMISSGMGYYSVRLTGMQVDGNRVPAIFGTAIIDSGTTYTYMGSTAYVALQGAISTYCMGHNWCGGTKRGHCWSLPNAKALDNFPDVHVNFGKVKTTWVPSAYMYRRGHTNTWCYSFQDDGPGASTVLGASWMLKQEIVFNMENKSVGIAQAMCPEFRQRPKRSLMVSSPSHTFQSASNLREARRDNAGPWFPAIVGGVVALVGAMFVLIACLLTPTASVSQRLTALVPGGHVLLSQSEEGDE